ncbi:UNVERIFIED_CONTAM: hypothetical protein K2H54_050932 [Gekko kuhli]
MTSIRLFPCEWVWDLMGIVQALEYRLKYADSQIFGVETELTHNILTVKFSAFDSNDILVGFHENCYSFDQGYFYFYFFKKRCRNSQERNEVFYLYTENS